MPGVAAIHNALRHVDSCSGDIRPIVDVGGLMNRTAVNSHAHPDMWVVLQRTADLQRTSRRLFRAAEKYQRHPVSGRQPDESPACFRRSETFRASHDLVELLQKFDLLVDQQFRIADNVD